MGETMRIDSIIIGSRFRKDLGDIESLSHSIAEVGLLHPVVVNNNGLLIAGRRRLEACRRLGLVDVPVTVLHLDNIVRGEYDENTCRKDFIPSEAVAIWKAMDSYQGRRSDFDTSCNEVKRIERAADATGYGQTTLSKAKAIVEAAEAAKELYGDLLDEMDKSGRVDRAYTKLKDRRRQAEATKVSQHISTSVEILSGDMVDIVPSLGTFDLIIADPPYNVTPWDWDNQGTHDEFIAQTRQWLLVSKEALKPNYHMFWFCSPDYAADIEIVIRELHLPIESRIIWHRRNMAKGSDARNKFIDTWEMIFHIGNRELNWPEQWTDERFDVQTFAVPQTNFNDKKLHPTQKPLDLIQRLVNFGSWPGERVLDPFAGSGTTAVACASTRLCVLVEKEEEYVRLLQSRFVI